MRFDRHALAHPGVAAALGAAVLFGAGAPLAKLLLNDVGPWLMAGLLYLGAGVGLLLYRRARRLPAEPIARQQLPWLAGVIVCGGVFGPTLLMVGLAAMPAGPASLLLNAEAVFTAVLAWLVFRENFDRRVLSGMALIVAGAVVLGWPMKDAAPIPMAPALAVMGACLAWAIDNNLTRKLALADATRIAAIKGLAAGGVNLVLAWVASRYTGPDAAASTAPWSVLVLAMLLGLLSYGVSLSLYVFALRHLGTARTGAYFSVAPFFGAVLAMALGEPLTGTMLVAGALMAAGVWLHLTERHAHSHSHPAVEHGHAHRHDAHHRHAHDGLAWDGREPHSHAHAHPPLRHHHEHFPDMHHRHEHGSAEDHNHH